MAAATNNEETEQKFTIIGLRDDYYKITENEVDIIMKSARRADCYQVSQLDIENNLLEYKNGVLIMDCNDEKIMNKFRYKHFEYETHLGVRKNIIFLTPEEIKDKILIGIEYVHDANNFTNDQLMDFIINKEREAFIGTWNFLNTNIFQDNYRFFVIDNQDNVVQYLNHVNNEIRIGLKKYKIYHYKDDNFPKHYFGNHLDFNMFYENMF